MTETTDTAETDEPEVEYVGDMGTLSELNAAFGWRLAFIPFAYLLLAFMYVTEPQYPNALLIKVFAAIIVLYTVVGPAEYLYHRSRITSADS